MKNNNVLPTDYQTFIGLARYAKWLDKEGRRETFAETVQRYITNVAAPVVGEYDQVLGTELWRAILDLSLIHI